MSPLPTPYLNYELNRRRTPVNQRIREFRTAIVDPDWVAARVEYLAEVWRATEADDVIGWPDLAARPRIDNAQTIEAILCRGFATGPKALSERIDQLVSDSGAILQLHFGVWARTDVAPEWTEALANYEEGSRLDRLARAAGKKFGLAADVIESLSATIRDTFFLPDFVTLSHGVAEQYVLAPLGRVRPPVCVEWSPVAALALDVSIRAHEDSEVVVQCANAATPLALAKRADGTDWSPGSYTADIALQLPDRIENAASQFVVVSDAIAQEIENWQNRLPGLLGSGNDLDRARIWGAFLEVNGLYLEAIDAYAEAYEALPGPIMGARILRCYRVLELDGLASRWAERLISDGHAA